jgi:hypothetical protein
MKSLESAGQRSPRCAQHAGLDDPYTWCSADRTVWPRIVADERCVKIIQPDELVGERPGLLLRPGVESGEERRLVDQAGL